MLLWLRTGVLSDKEIKRLLGKKLFIWPFSEKNLKGSTYNLTASLVARSIATNKLLVNENREIVIPPGDGALIETEESIFVEKDISGTYHSKVKLVSKGLSHIGTTLDPLFLGTSLIAVHNPSPKPQTIKVGETFVSLMLHKMPSSTKLLHDNQPFRQDIISVKFTKEDFPSEFPSDKQDMMLEEINEWMGKQWRFNKDALAEIVKEYVKKRDEKKKLVIVDLLNYVASAAIIGVLLYFAHKGKFKKNFDTTLVIGVATLIIPLFGGLSKLMKDYFRGD